MQNAEGTLLDRLYALLDRLQLRVYDNRGTGIFLLDSLQKVMHVATRNGDLNDGDIKIDLFQLRQGTRIIGGLVHRMTDTVEEVADIGTEIRVGINNEQVTHYFNNNLKQKKFKIDISLLEASLSTDV
jgi:hypothetical protein